MKKLLIFINCIVYAATAYSQNINFNWVQPLVRATGLPFDESYFIGIDAQKNVYVAGNFHFTVDLDPGPGVTNVNSKVDNIFVCKFNSSGNFIWGRHLGNNDRYTVCKSLSVDTGGNIYTTGYFTGKADFDPGPEVYNLTANATVNAESPDIFISKLNSNGDFEWAKQTGSSSIDIGNAINADIFGNVYITGYFSGVTDLDPGPGSFNKGNPGVVNTFITKLDASGNFKFAKVFEGNHTSIGKFIRTDSKGNVYTSGYFAGDVDFDPGPAVRNFTTEIFTQNNFLSKLDSAGNYVWAIRDVTGLDIAADDYGNIYTYDANLTKYDINGNLVWRKPMGGTPNSTIAPADIKVDGIGNIYLTGRFRYTQDFDPGPAEYKLTTIGAGYASDVFVCKLDGDGSFLWARSFGGTLEDYATGLTIDNAENIYTTGVFLGNVDFDPGPEVHNLTSAPGGGVFVHKMSPCKNNLPDTLHITVCKNYTLNNITYKSSGTYTQIIPTNTGCDSIIQLNLKINRIDTNIQAATCDSYLFGGTSLTATGKYSDTLQSINGCDSIVNLDLTITKSVSSINAAICIGQTYNGHSVAGTYTDTFQTTNGCDSLVTLYLSILPKPAPALGSDRELCAGDSITLVPGNYESFIWNDGSTSPYYNVKKTGSYSVTVTNLCGVGYDEIKVTEASCKMFFPGAFTPNNDGRNERFSLLNPHRVNDFQLSVYNRFGQLVFQTKDYTKGWTGMYKGVAAQPGTYVWYCKFREAGVLNNLKGTVLLLR